MFRFASVKRLNRETFAVARLIYTRVPLGSYVVLLVYRWEGTDETLTVLGKALDLANSRVLRFSTRHVNP
jgi:hypothetical protein